MIVKTHSLTIKQTFKTIDWKLLVFLLLFLNVKLVVKLAAILFIYIFHPDFKFGFRLRNSRLPFFYLFVIAIGLLDYFTISGFKNLNYSIVFITAAGFWYLDILAIHQIKLSVERHEAPVVHRTISVFFIINVIVSLSALFIIICKTGVINPYLYQGEYQKYFIGTGDYIRGASFDTSTTNAVLNAFGVIYFLSRKKALMAMMCMIVLLLTASNITNLILCTALFFVFIFQSDKDQKSLILVCLFFLVIFMAKVSPQNNQYLLTSFKNMINDSPVTKLSIRPAIRIEERADCTLSPEEKRQQIADLYLDSLSQVNQRKQTFTNNLTVSTTLKPAIPVDDINGPKFQHKSFTTPVEENMFHFIASHSSLLPVSSDTMFHPKYPGKIISLQQTFAYLKSNPSKILTGAGAGNFSSKLAFKTSGIKIGGSWPSKFIYVNQAFLQNHLDLYLYYFSKTDGLHSAVNNPASVYDQLFSEYGIVGLLAFFILYVGFFLKRLRDLSFAIPLILVLCGIFFFDYWFEQLSIVILFELLMFLNLKEMKDSK